MTRSDSTTWQSGWCPNCRKKKLHRKAVFPNADHEEGEQNAQLRDGTMIAAPHVGGIR
jgi:hypothetical protein